MSSTRHNSVARRASRTVYSDREESSSPARGVPIFHHPTPSFSHPSAPIPAHVQAVDNSTEPLAVQKLQAELELAEAELRAARLKYAYIQAKEQAEQETYDGRKNDIGSGYDFGHSL
ncbi:hypothetical protein ACN47E_001144 [Coniothyrium glycines]